MSDSLSSLHFVCSKTESANPFKSAEAASDSPAAHIAAVLDAIRQR